jgi:Fe-S cluster assembly protein SufD
MSVTVSDKNITNDLTASIANNLPIDASIATLRAEGLEALQKLGLPANKAEEYKFTPVTRFLEKNFNVSAANPQARLSSVDDFKIAPLDATIIVFVNGIFAKELSSRGAEDVTLLTLKEALAQKNESLLKHLGKYADHKSDGLTAWNTASFNDGVFIEVGNNKVIEKPIVLHHIHDASAGQVITSNRNLIVVGKSSELTVVEKFDSVGASPNFSNTVTEAVVAENAKFNLYSIQNDSGARYQYGLTHIHQYDASRVNTYTFTLNGKLVRNNLQLSLDGEGIESHMYGLYLLTGDTLGDNHTVVDHKKANSFSNELYKGIMDGSSKGVFNGKIYVRPNAQKTNAFQANRNILLTDKATVNTKPQLEIWADDVKCSHGCTTGQLDEEAVFYLQSRGVSKENAQAMMLYAFAGEVLKHVKHPVLKDYLDSIIGERLHKNF